MSEPVRERAPSVRAPSTPVTIAPNLVVPDGDAAVAFYENAFGAQVLHRVPDGGVAALGLEGAPFWVSEASAERRRSTPTDLGATSVWMIVTVADPDATWQRAVDAGAVAESPVEDAYDWRVGSVVDPWGHRWEIGRPLVAWPPAG